MPELLHSCVKLLVVFPLWSVFIGFVTAHLSGWNALSKRYRADSPPDGVTYRNRAGLGCGNLHCGAVLHITLTSAGCHMASAWWTRPFHPPLLLPWRHLKSITPKRFFFRRALEARFVEPDGLPLTINLPMEALALLEDRSSGHKISAPFQR